MSLEDIALGALLAGLLVLTWLAFYSHDLVRDGHRMREFEREHGPTSTDRLEDFGPARPNMRPDDGQD